jgi:rubrerythrin
VSQEAASVNEDFEKRTPHAEELNAMTAASLRAAFAGESQAAEKYLVFALQAEAEGLPNIARLFTAISFAETRHARNHLRVLGGIGSTVDNLQTAFEGESFEIDEMYPAYGEIAKVQANRQASRSIKYALKAERDHRTMYADAKKAAVRGDDVAAAKVSVCLICGHTVIGDVPDKCPVCGTVGSQYRTF